MPDFQNLSRRKLARGNISNFPKMELACTINDSQSGRVDADLRGAAAIVFPDVLVTLTDADRDEFMDFITPWLLEKLRPELFGLAAVAVAPSPEAPALAPDRPSLLRRILGWLGR
jgi:hypothetical protein